MKQTTYKVVLCLQYLSSCDYLHLLTKFWPLEQFSLRWEESSLINTYCLFNPYTDRNNVLQGFVGCNYFIIAVIAYVIFTLTSLAVYPSLYP